MMATLLNCCLCIQNYIIILNVLLLPCLHADVAEAAWSSPLQQECCRKSRQAADEAENWRGQGSAEEEAAELGEGMGEGVSGLCG